MADQHDHNDQNEPQDGGPAENESNQPLNEGVPVEEEPMDVEETPRRAASAEFVVEGEVGSEAALREAMDPANQSLREALRLSFRVLQVVIIGLLIFFLFSGFETIQEGRNGVRLVFKKIVPTGPDGALFLEPGAQLNWPYPIGDFYIFEVENRSVELHHDFWPYRPGLTTDQAIEQAQVTEELRPGYDGYVLTRQGDIAHIQVQALFEVQNPLTFVQRVNQDDHYANAERIVQYALRRAVVQTAGSMTLREIVEARGEAAVFEADLIEHAQRTLDQLNCGIRLTSARIQETRPAFAVATIYDALQEAREQTATEIQRARDSAEEELISLAGPLYRRALDLIEDYEMALLEQDGLAAEQYLVQINELLESPEAGGQIASIIQEARDFESQIEFTLGNETREFLGLLPVYRENPELVIKERWLRTYGKVLSNADAEKWFVLPGGGDVMLRVFRSERVKEERRRLDLDRQREAGDPLRDWLMPGTRPEVGDIEFGRPGRILRPDRLREQRQRD